MRFLFALYDSAYNVGGGNYWTWHHPELGVASLDALYYQFARQHTLLDVAKLTSEDLMGGYACVNESLWCWYRWFDGGRDRSGRLGRRILLAAFTPATPPKGVDFSRVIFDLMPFTHLAESASRHCPIAAPDSLECTWAGIPVKQFVGVDGSPNGKRMNWTGDVATHEAINACAYAPIEAGWHCVISRIGPQSQARVVNVSRNPPVTAVQPLEQSPACEAKTRLFSHAPRRLSKAISARNKTMFKISAVFAAGLLFGLFVARYLTWVDDNNRDNRDRMRRWFGILPVGRNGKVSIDHNDFMRRIDENDWSMMDTRPILNAVPQPMNKRTSQPLTRADDERP